MNVTYQIKPASDKLGPDHAWIGSHLSEKEVWWEERGWVCDAGGVPARGHVGSYLQPWAVFSAIQVESCS